MPIPGRPLNMRPIILAKKNGEFVKHTLDNPVKLTMSLHTDPFVVRGGEKIIHRPGGPLVQKPLYV